MTAGFHTRRFVRSLMLTVVLGLCVLVSLPQPGLAQTPPESGSASAATSTTGATLQPPATTIGPAAASSSAGRASDDAPPDVRLVFGFTAGTVLVLSALAFLDRRPEP